MIFPPKGATAVTKSARMGFSPTRTNADVSRPSAARSEQQPEQAAGQGAETGTHADRAVVLRPGAVDSDEAEFAPRLHSGIFNPRLGRHVVLECVEGLVGRLLAFEHERFESVRG
jgi:hypothetical protein